MPPHRRRGTVGTRVHPATHSIRSRAHASARSVSHKDTGCLGVSASWPGRHPSRPPPPLPSLYAPPPTRPPSCREVRCVCQGEWESVSTATECLFLIQIGGGRSDRSNRGRNDVSLQKASTFNHGGFIWFTLAPAAVGGRKRSRRCCVTRRLEMQETCWNL